MSATHYETIVVEKEDNVAKIILNRPESLNALTQTMHAELRRAVEDVAGDESIRALVLTGAGRGFCSGRDVHDLRDWGREARTARPKARLPQSGAPGPRLIRALEIPTIAMINGPAAGAGLGIAMVCDLRFASDRAFFTEIYAQRGLPPSTGTWYLPRLVGLSHAMDMILTGRRIDANEAERLGLVSRVFAHEVLEEETMKIAHQLASLPSFTLKLAKQAVLKGLESGLQETLHFVGYLRQLHRALAPQELEEGSGRFLEGASK